MNAMQPEDWETPDHSNQDAYDELLAAIAASENQLSLLIAVCNDPGLRAEIIQRYETDLAPDFRHYRLTLARGEPSLKAAINQAIADHEDLKQGSKAVLTLTGIEQLHFLSFGEAKSEQDIFFGYLQWTREGLREFQFPIVIWVTYQILAQLSRKSPDFWSWRRGVFRFVSRKTIAVPVRELDAFRQEPMLSDLDEDALIPIDDLKALIQQTEQRNPNDPLLATLYNQMGRIHADRIDRGEDQDYQTEQAQAIEYFQKAIRLQEPVPEQALDLANSLIWLGYLYKSQGRYAEAEPLYVRSLSIREQQLGQNHPHVASSLNNLASLYESLGRYAEAEPLYVRSLSIWEQQLGQNHPDVASSLNNLAGLYYSQGRYAEAEPLYVRSLSIWEQQLGQNHPDVAGSLNNLAGLYYSQGRYAEAEPLYVRSLSIREQQLGQNHPHVASSLNNLALLYKSQGRYTESEPLLVRSLSIQEQQLGQNHPHVASSLNNLAGLYESQGRYAEAELLHMRSLSIREQQLGQNHPDVAQSLNNLALLYKSQGRYAEAEPLYEKSLSIAEKTLGIDHPRTVTIGKNLTTLRSHLQKNRLPHSP